MVHRIPHEEMQNPLKSHVHNAWMVGHCDPLHRLSGSMPNHGAWCRSANVRTMLVCLDILLELLDEFVSGMVSNEYILYNIVCIIVK